MLKFNIAASLFLAAAIFPFVAAAHLVGYSFEKVNGNYKVDIGYDSLDKNPPANEALRFDFRLEDPTGQKDVDYSRVFFSLTENDATIFSEILDKPEFGPSEAAVTLPKAGDYQLYARYEKDSNVLVEQTFNMTVVPDDESQTSNPGKPDRVNIFYLAGGLLAGILGTFLVTRKNSKT